MTTIATDGKTIAADGMIHRGGTAMVRNGKKIVVHTKDNPPAIYGLAGASGMHAALIAWHRRGADPKDVPPIGSESGWALIVVTAEGCFTAGDQMPYLCPVDTPFAVGSGSDLAIGAMDAGVSPEEAVRIACWRDTHTGGEIQVVNIAEALGVIKPNGASVHEDRRIPAASQAWLNY